MTTPDFPLDFDFGDTPGYFLVTYQGDPPPQGPFPTVPAMAAACSLHEYPANGYVAWWDAADPGTISNVPSLNPDDLLVQAENQRSAR